MSPVCADLDPFFDGELAEAAAAEFRSHLAGCKRCQSVMRGRMQEEAIAGELPVRAAQPEPQDDVSPIRRVARWRKVAYVTPILAAAAALVIWFVGVGAHEPASAIALSLTVEHRGAATRGSARVGDVLRAIARGGRHRAIWVYRGGDLVAACPGDATCAGAEGSLTLAYPIAASGSYRIIAIDAAQPIPVGSPDGPGRLDVMLSSIAAAGGHFEMRRLDVY